MRFDWFIVGFFAFCTVGLVGIAAVMFASSVELEPVFKGSEPSYQVYVYRDVDGDGRGNPSIKKTINQGVPVLSGYTVVVGDCDDNDSSK